MKLGILFSGGKDSTYAAFLAKNKGHKLSCLISVISKNKESYMYHTPNIRLVDLQAKAANISLIKVQTKGEKEKELKDLEKAIILAKKKYKIEGIVSGAVASTYQASRIQRICNKLNLWCINPLWQKDQEILIREIINSGFKFVITKIAALGLDKTWLGKVIENKDIDKLVQLNKKYGINIAFEGGEAETFVYDCPLFDKKIKILKAQKIYKNYSGIYQILKAKLEAQK